MASVTVRNPDGQQGSGTFTYSAGPPPSTGTHARYDALKALPQCIGAWDLRSMASIRSVMNKGNPPAVLANWDYDAALDAARLVWKDSEAKPPAGEKLWFPVKLGGQEVILVTLTVRFSREFMSIARGGFLALDGYTHKEYGFLAENRIGNDGTGVWGHKFNFKRTAIGADLGTISDDMQGAAGAGIIGTRNEPPTPAGVGCVAPNSLPFRHSEFITLVTELRLNQPFDAFVDWKALTGAFPVAGQPYHMGSRFVIDSRGIHRLVFRRPIPTFHPATGAYWNWVNAFRTTHDTSSHLLEMSGDAWMHERNVVVLKNYLLDGANPETAYPLVFQA